MRVLVVLVKVIVGPNNDIVVEAERIELSPEATNFVAAGITTLSPKTETLELPDKLKAAVFKAILVAPDNVTPAADLAFRAVLADNVKVAPENKLKFDDADNPTFVPAVVAVVPLKCKVDP